MGLQEEVKCLDLGCGIGGVMRDLASTKATLTGITIAPNEEEIGFPFCNSKKFHNFRKR